MKEKLWLILLLLLLLELSNAASSASGRPFHAMLHGIVASSSNINATDVNSMAVDEQLYSRQLLVYGKSAQKRMQDAHVLVIGDSPLTAEIVKNLALAGLGRISISGSDGTSVGKEGYASLQASTLHRKILREKVQWVRGTKGAQSLEEGYEESGRN